MGFFIADHRIKLDFADYFYGVNCIATINFRCVTHLYVPIAIQQLHPLFFVPQGHSVGSINYNECPAFHRNVWCNPEYEILAPCVPTERQAFSISSLPILRPDGTQFHFRLRLIF